MENVFLAMCGFENELERLQLDECSPRDRIQEIFPHRKGGQDFSWINVFLGMGWIQEEFLPRKGGQALGDVESPSLQVSKQ